MEDKSASGAMNDATATTINSAQGEEDLMESLCRNMEENARVRPEWGGCEEEK